MSERAPKRQRKPKTIDQALRAFPLFDEPFLRMQLLNLDIVDRFLREEERQLLHAYFELDRTPPEAALVSALSQLWTFGLYELLRTWRQRAKAIIGWAKEYGATPNPLKEEKFASKQQEITRRARALKGMVVFHWSDYARAVEDAVFRQDLTNAYDRSERLFKRIEALRVALAKHEMPGAVGSFAMAPGYGRIDEKNGSIYWEVAWKGLEIDQVSRREIADDCIFLGSDRRDVILPENLQEKIKRKNFQEVSYGVKRVVAELYDGTEHRGVFVAWAKEILGGTSFGAKDVADVRPDSEGEQVNVDLQTR